ncbi:MAG: sensor histidine kinase [Opitutales bacterium]
MPHSPLNDLPDPLFLVISRTNLLAHNAHRDSPWHSFFDGHLNQSWANALTEALNAAAPIIAIESAIVQAPIQGNVRTPLNSDGEWLQICAQWYTDGDSEKTYLTLSKELKPLESGNAGDEELDAVASRALLLRLKQAESKLETYLHHFPGILFSQRPDGSFAFISPRIEEWIGNASQRLNRSTSGLRDLIAPEDRENALQTIQENSPKGQPYSLQYRILNPETRALIYIYDIRLPIVLSNGTHLQDEGIWIDVTRQAVAENRISSSLWKENLSTITSGLVHDFSNSMAGIFSLSELYHAEMEPDHPRQEGMGQIKQHAMRAQTLVRRIVDMNRDIAGETAYHNLEVLIRDHEDIIGIILPKSAKLDFQFPDQELLVYLDEVAFRQALIHFVTNARDALRDGGTFGIHIECIDKGFNIHIWDDGPGIPEHDRSRIFEPFFSTKQDQSAAGFGLYAAKAFAESAGGSISLGENKFPGAHFILFLPDADSARPSMEESSFHQEEASTSLIADAAQAPQLSSNGSIVIVSKDEEATQYLAQGLAPKNWSIHEYLDSQDAAQNLEDSGASPSVIIFALGTGVQLKSDDLEPLNQWADEAMTTLFLMPDTERPPDDITESFDMLLDTSLGIEGIRARLEPWMA